MPTTIQISDMTKQVLEKLKEKEHAHSYDQVIQLLVQKHTPSAASLFGSIKGLAWKKKDRLELNGL